MPSKPGFHISSRGPLAFPGKNPPVSFEDVSELIPFEHRSLQFHGGGLSGAVWFDYNNDGLLDLLLTNGKTQKNALFRNNGDGTFTDVAEEAGVANGLGNSGAVAADIDNDGYQDLLLLGSGGIEPLPFGTTEKPQLKLYHNNGDGTFTDITASSGLVGPDTQMMAVFGDIDNDGFLDLYLTAPGSFNPVPGGTAHRAKLYRNNGDLTFTDISASAGVDILLGSCVALFSDYDNDGWMDLFVGDCNELGIRPTPIHLFRNNRNLTFTDVAPEAGLAAGGYWMCMAPGDFNNDGNIDLFVSNFGKVGAGPMAVPLDQPHALYRNNGDGTYFNVGARAGVANFEFGWGGVMTDFDNDGWADLFFVGTLPDPRFLFFGPGRGNGGTLMFNQRNGTFANFSDAFKQWVQPRNLSLEFPSGVAHGDFDNDGFEDLLITVTSLPLPDVPPTSGQPLLLRNRGNKNRWVKIHLQGTTCNRDAVGARVEVVSGDLRQTKEVYAGSGFGCMSSQWLNFGIAQNRATERILVRWPHGRWERFPNVRAGSTVTLVEGKGKPVKRGSLR